MFNTATKFCFGATFFCVVLSMQTPARSQPVDAPAQPPRLATQPTTQPIVLDAQAPESPAQTQPSETAQSQLLDIRAWFTDLEAPDQTARSAALNHLMGLASADLDLLHKVVAESQPLAPAQASVLRQIVMQAYLSGQKYEAMPSGFLGVMMEAATISFESDDASKPATAYGIMITRRLPGFCGARCLKDGDLVLGILERPDAPLQTLADLQTLISTTGAGHVATLQVLRQGQVIRVPIRLDARPANAAAVFGLEELLQQRQQAAQQYWDTHFADLVKDDLS